MKQIIISVAGTDGSREYTDVQILPATKPRDVLAQLGLNGFQLNKPEGGALGFNDDLYQAVSDGQKVFVTKADVEAGRQVRLYRKLRIENDKTDQTIGANSNQAFGSRRPN